MGVIFSMFSSGQTDIDCVGERAGVEQDPAQVPMLPVKVRKLKMPIGGVGGNDGGCGEKGGNGGMHGTGGEEVERAVAKAAAKEELEG